MRGRPIRSQIYLPVVRFGVVDTDWKFVISIVLLCYCIPYLFDLRIMNFPLEIWASLIGLAASVAFFNFVRKGRRPFWLQHQIGALAKRARQRHSLPADEKARGWLLNE
jgi:hypothetical protein